MHDFPQKKLQNIVGNIWSSTHSSFYRELWEHNNIQHAPEINTKSDFEQIPYLSREMVSSYEDPNDRLYIDLMHVDMLRTTSGTSSGSPLLLWRNFTENYSQYKMEEVAQQVCAMLFQPYHANMSSIIKGREAGKRIICGDAHNLSHSANLAKLTETDALIIPPTLAIVFADYLNKEYSTEKIKRIEFWGEYCSAAMKSVLKKHYPRAHFVFLYSTSESNGCVAYSTDKCNGSPQTMHYNTKDFYVEIVDDELILTTLRSSLAMPLIRYRTGDAAEFVEETCTCDNQEPRITITGRIDSDIIRIAGGEIRAEELDRVLQPLLSFIEPTYQLHVDEKIDNGKRTGMLTLLASKRSGINTPDDSLKTMLLKTMLDSMRLSQNMTLQNAIDSQLLLLPHVHLLSEVSVKTKNPKLKQLFT